MIIPEVAIFDSCSEFLQTEERAFSFYPLQLPKLLPAEAGWIWAVSWCGGLHACPGGDGCSPGHPWLAHPGLRVHLVPGQLFWVTSGDWRSRLTKQNVPSSVSCAQQWLKESGRWRELQCVEIVDCTASMCLIRVNKFDSMQVLPELIWLLESLWAQSFSFQEALLVWAPCCAHPELLLLQHWS